MRIAAVVALVALVLAAGAQADGFLPSPGTLTGWDGVVGPQGTVRYVALPTKGAATTVAAVRVSDGRVLRWTWSPVRGDLGIPLVTNGGLGEADGISANSRTLVLASLPGTLPGGGTRLAVLRLPGLRSVKLIDLPGLWSFDAISPDGRTIYAIEYLSGRTVANPRYRVRAIDVGAGRARRGAIVDRREPGPMVGVPRARAYGEGRRFAFTLYTRQNGTAFVHALDTVRATARCIDLPRRAITEPVALRLRVVDRALEVRQRGRVLARVDLDRAGPAESSRR
ncbi:MAG: hypothetical protein U0R50_08715 [Gaiellales bacterium]